ncbi:MAG TPA: gas vesicle protein [Methanotrichaceae archaeon]|nr:gas vesicle protein [Methanotrichaceae archaeon]
MKPERDDYGLVDILDRLLNKGVILNADLIITVAGIPLVGLSLKAALASIETMLDYGMLEAWDRETREWYKKQFEESNVPLMRDEMARYTTFGYIWYSQGMISSWRPGFWYITNKRLLLWRRMPYDTLFEAPLENIGKISVRKMNEFGWEREEINLQFQDEIARIRVSNLVEFEGAIRKAMRDPEIEIARS